MPQALKSSSFLIIETLVLNTKQASHPKGKRSIIDNITNYKESMIGKSGKCYEFTQHITMLSK